MFDLPTSKPRISPSAKSAGPSRIRIRLISTFALFRGEGAYAKSSGASWPRGQPHRWGEERADKAICCCLMSPSDRVAAVRALRDISLLLQLKGENAFRCRAYEVGADRLAGRSEELGTLVAEGKLENQPGIGQALAEKITELATTGRMRFLDELR